MRTTMIQTLATVLLAVAGCTSGGSTSTDMSVPWSGAAGSGNIAVAPSGAAQPSAPASAPAVTASPTTSPMLPAAGTNSAMPASAAPSAATATQMSVPATPAVATTPPPAASGGPIPENCRGFDFNGLKYSPGGEVLPNTCEAFHATMNNPYAVRCIDAWPWFKTKFPGDQYCVLPPQPDKGIQLGHHPQGEYDAWFQAVSQGDMSGYDNVPADWQLAPGAEEERNINIRHKNPAGKYDRTNTRMRGGSHHMIASSVQTVGQTFVWGPGSPEGLFGGKGVPGAQRPDENNPQSQKFPPENVGLYSEIDADVTVTYNMHHFNPTDRPILKEAWQNIWWAENPMTHITGLGTLPVEEALGTFANPGEIVDFHYATTAPGPLRVLGVFGHRHAWTTNFSAWVVRGGKEEIIYQSFDWFDEPTYQYNSEVKNPVPNPTARQDAGYTGIMELKAGDELHFNCHIEYTDARAKEANSPVMPAQNGPLRFANQAFTAEMCILFGAGVGTNGSVARMGPPPDFAKVR